MLFILSFSGRTHQHKVMALFAWCKELQEPSPSRLGRAQRHHSDRHTVLQAALPGESSPAAGTHLQPGTQQVHGNTGDQRHCNTCSVHGNCTTTSLDTYLNRKGAEAPDTYHALLLLLGKAYTGCFHHLHFSLSCYNFKSSCFPFNHSSMQNNYSQFLSQSEIKKTRGKKPEWV